MIHIGIDPGLSGAIAVVSDDAVDVTDMPTLEIVVNKKHRREINLHELRDILAQFNQVECHVFLEKISGMPGMGGTTMFSLGRSYGQIEATLVGIGLPVTKVPSMTWKKAMLPKSAIKGKEASRARALEMFPAMAGKLSRKKDDGRAESLLIAEFGRRTHRDFGTAS